MESTETKVNIQGEDLEPGGLYGLTFAGYVPLASQNPYPIVVYSVDILKTPSYSRWENKYFSQSQPSHFLFMYLAYKAF